jgi:hypothetical protein
MPRVKSIWLVSTALFALALLPSQAQAMTRPTADCYAHNNKLTRHYSVAQLRNALATMPADVKEYTSCYEVIEDQLFRQLGRPVPGTGRSSRSSTGSVISTPLLIVLIVVVLGGGGLAYVAWRRGGGGGGTPPAAAG